ncbi:sulfurtransferase complex subunit TusD [Otariodibacter sp.]|uniref:sulfurtransferase complex subunit TusD n=1 Tax=Otariodibacter sp. TaxID=3030919 RepID=UPI0026335813|nr:sulfurtransferase complex subunit TusD [Otariodibacter sp.]
MKYVIAIRHSVYGNQGAYLAYQIVQELLVEGHTITQIFFFQDGVSNANKFVYPANDEVNLVENWKSLAETYRLPLHLCISAAQRRGIVENNLSTHFTLAGLGEFSQTILQADRLLTF